MERNRPEWAVGDTCVLIVSVPKRYTQEFKVQGFDGSYYTLKRGNDIHHAAPDRMFRTKEEALAFLDAGNSRMEQGHSRKEKMEWGQIT